MCPAAYGTINTPSVGADAYIGPPTALLAPLRRGGRPCPPARKALLVTLCRGDPRGRPPAMHHTPWKPCHCEVSAHTGRGNPYLPSPNPPLPKGGGPAALWWRDTYGVWGVRLQEAGAGIPAKRDRLLGRSETVEKPSGFFRQKACGLLRA